MPAVPAASVRHGATWRYFDASALTKRYVREPESVTVRRLLARGRAATSRLSEVEVASAFARRVRDGSVSARDRDRALAAFIADVATMLVIEVTPDITALARRLLARHPLRASDAIQLASCLSLHTQLSEPVPLVAFDDRLNEAARGEGVHVAERLA
jgi:predicted nucleic acid-binding protein